MNIVIPVEGETRKFSPADGKKFTLEELQSAVGGKIEFVPSPQGRGYDNCRDPYVVIADEEGVLKSKAFNTGASFLVGYPLVGDVVIVEEKYVE